MGSWQDKDDPQDGKVAWYPSYPGEQPVGGVDKSKIESIEEDSAKQESTLSSNQETTLFGSGNPVASVSSKGEIIAEANAEFQSMFGEDAPKEVQQAYINQLQSLQRSRTTKKTTVGGVDYTTQGVSPQERKDILDNLVKAFGTGRINAANAGDATALAAMQKGKFGVTYTNLKKAYADNGIPFNNAVLAGQVVESAINQDKYNSNLNLINLQAKTYFPALADKIDKGYTVRQLLSPYLQTRANILEEDADAIDLKELQGVAKDPKNLMGLYEYEVSLRKDPKWRFTKNAQDSLSNVARSLAQTFGLIG